MNIRAIAQMARNSFCIGLTALMLCAGFVLSSPQSALAGNRAANVVQNRAEQEFDRVAGAGTAEQIKGNAEEVQGRMQRQAGRVTNDMDSRVEGAAKQAQGRVTKDIGRTQSAAEDAANRVEDASDNLVDSVKDFFN